MRRGLRLLSAASALGLLLTACNHTATPQNVPSTLNLTSPDIPGDVIPSKFTCDGQDASPALSWNEPPSGTKSFVVIVTDKDSGLGSVLGGLARELLGYFLHWLVYDIPPDARAIPAGLPKQAQLPDGSRQGENDFAKTGYGGPCPPGHTPHHYVFEIFALNKKLDLPAGTSEKQVVNAMNGHVLAKGQLVATYSR